MGNFANFVNSSWPSTASVLGETPGIPYLIFNTSLTHAGSPSVSYLPDENNKLFSHNIVVVVRFYLFLSNPIVIL